MKHISAAILASTWCLSVAILIEVMGGPVGLRIEWTLVWGLFPALLASRVPLLPLYAAALGVENLLAPSPHPGLTAACAAFGFLPAQLFVRWTMKNRCLTIRAALHVLFYAALILGVLPMLLVESGFGDWTAITRRSSWANKVLVQLLFIPAIILIAAVKEFVRRGKGTPMPSDPPERLVTSGVFSYVSNPFQIGKISMLTAWALFWGNPGIMALAAIALCYSLAIALPREDRDLTERFGSAWLDYRLFVPRWRPRWKPYHRSVHDAHASLARLYLDLECGACGELASWIMSRRPIGLQIEPIDRSGTSPRRMTYDPSDGGPKEEGVAALARCLEHANLGLAFIGWMIRLPLVCAIAQSIADDVGAGPRVLNGCKKPSCAVLPRDPAWSSPKA